MRASSKGLLTGNVKFQDPQGQLFDCSDNAISISDQWISCPDKIKIESSARFILVVEKETVFNRLLSDGFSKRLPCIIITGKGIPDLATRKCLRKLVDTLNVPSLGLCDCNPYGIALMLCKFDIFLTYSHENRPLKCIFDLLMLFPLCQVTK